MPSPGYDAAQVIFVSMKYSQSFCPFTVNSMLNSPPFNYDAYAILSNWDFGMLVFTINVVVVNFTLFYITKYWTFLNHLFYWGTLVVYFVFSFGFGFIR